MCLYIKLYHKVKFCMSTVFTVFFQLILSLVNSISVSTDAGSFSFNVMLIRAKSSFIVCNQVCLGRPTLFVHGWKTSYIAFRTGVSDGNLMICPRRFNLLLLIDLLHDSVFVILLSSSFDILSGHRMPSVYLNNLR